MCVILRIRARTRSRNQIWYIFRRWIDVRHTIMIFLTDDEIGHRAVIKRYNISYCDWISLRTIFARQWCSHRHQITSRAIITRQWRFYRLWLLLKFNFQVNARLSLQWLLPLWFWFLLYHQQPLTHRIFFLLRIRRKNNTALLNLINFLHLIF